jgi:hypothetical protein
VREKVETALAKLRPCFKDTDISLRDISGDVIKVEILVRTPCCDPSRDHGPTLTKYEVLKLLEEQFKDEVPEVKEVIAV